MPVKRRIRCLLFDLGSTLWEHGEETQEKQAKEESYRRAGNLLHAARGGNMFAAQDALTLGRLVRKTTAQYLRAEKHQRPDFEPDFVLATLKALWQLGLAEADHELAAAVFEALRVRIPVSRVLFPDTLSTLQTLKQRGYILGVVTNRDYGGQPFRDDLQTMGLLDYFEYQHIAISADLGIRKPHPGIFKYALERLSVPPEEAAMVGDNLQADVGGARSLNMLGIWKPKPAARSQEPPESPTMQPDLTIDQLQDLLQVF